MRQALQPPRELVVHAAQGGGRAVKGRQPHSKAARLDERARDAARRGNGERVEGLVGARAQLAGRGHEPHQLRRPHRRHVGAQRLWDDHVAGVPHAARARSGIAGWRR